ncbi:hypothetical protein C8P68_11246 [Mucilaginibacter yixingensis]|uniref:Fibronectin type-III domain-containing protein n=1 Tax=Mucilaginibacter yixingensis TaxID=1295612 RepID=A0A2T5J4K7_9SPHI|nr:hypothetical protein [Mucilaginibacter yixingensis]PTQ92446.1 hypothetical protein C8P68_11246 [Mucilaginibacter yixingensis]
MKLNLIPYYLMLMVLVGGLASSCKEFIESDISGSKIQPEAPGNNYQSANYNVQFWWDQVDDALTYRLQVVAPKFDSVSRLVLDTVVKTNVFSINLEPGVYQWRVQAENGSSKTAFSTGRNFTIFFSSIKQQKVQLTSPANGFLTNQATIAFQWGSLYGATKYRLEIDTNSFADENTLVYNQVTPAQQLNFNFQKDQTYQWRVRAENDTAQAQWSAINTMTYDHTPPNRVNLTAPANNQSLSLPASLQWSATTTATKYKLYVLRADSTTLYNSTFPVALSTTNYNFNLGTTGETIYWKVSAIDAAGNEGQASTLRHFVIQ